MQLLHNIIALDSAEGERTGAEEDYGGREEEPAP